MNARLKEVIILLLQLFMFYIFPLFSGPLNAMVMVLSIVLMTFLLSAVLGILSKSKTKYLYPIVIAVLFIPSVFIYYNESALVHSVWYLVVSGLGLMLGSVINIILASLNKKRQAV